jgi:outer membrane protein assembly factor BamA
MFKKPSFFLSFILLVSLVLASCSAKRLVPEGRHIITKNDIIIDEKKTTFTKSDLYSFVSQKPHRSFLGVRFKLWTYYVTETKKTKKFWGWVHDKMGVEPVYYDEFTAMSNADQMKRYLDNVGHMQSAVKPEVKLNEHTAELVFKVTASWPYTISETESTIPDTTIAAFVTSIHNNSLIKTGDVLNMYTLSNERDRITEHLKNNGYFYFSTDYIHFEIDTNYLSRKAFVKMSIDNVISSTNNASGQIQKTPHKRYYINQVSIFPVYTPLINNPLPPDTVLIEVQNPRENTFHNQYFVYAGDPLINIKRFDQIIHIKDKEAFSISKVKDTYRGLSNFRIYGNSNITFDTNVVKHNFENDEKNWLNCNILLQRNKLNGYAVELEGTNSSGDLGIKGSVVFQNKNIFRGSEQLRLRANAGFEAQQIRSADTESGEKGVFNTTEVGFDATIFFPRFLSPVYLKNFIRDYQPKTNITTGINAQNRINYSRFIINLAFGYDWMASPTVQHLLTVININSVKVDPSASFQEELDKETNQRIKDQYSNHLIIGLKYSYIFNNQNINKVNDFFYFRANFESSGNALSLFNARLPVDTTNNQHQLLGVSYAQFFRFDFDFRYYHLLTENNRLVFRTIIGAGLPYGNSLEMPFERSFYSGGANGMRGWQFRELGPGSYNGTDDVERIGDIQLEASGEYRFPIYSMLRGALFMDVGNIWTINESSYLPGGKFEMKTFYKELAVDAGFGLRFDFSFFIFRLDYALPLRDPARDDGDRWMIDKLQLSHSQFNFGIGYPF